MHAPVDRPQLQRRVDARLAVVRLELEPVDAVRIRRLALVAAAKAPVGGRDARLERRLPAQGHEPSAEHRHDRVRRRARSRRRLRGADPVDARNEIDRLAAECERSRDGRRHRAARTAVRK